MSEQCATLDLSRDHAKSVRAYRPDGVDWKVPTRAMGMNGKPSMVDGNRNMDGRMAYALTARHDLNVTP